MKSISMAFNLQLHVLVHCTMCFLLRIHSVIICYMSFIHHTHLLVTSSCSEKKTECWLLWSVDILYATLLSGNLALTYVAKHRNCGTVFAQF